MEHFEFDPAKSRLNEERHGVDLEWAQGLWDVTHVIIPAKNVIGEGIRLISCHRADRRLERIYENKVRS